jgi:DNA topoisomerase-1
VASDVASHQSAPPPRLKRVTPDDLTIRRKRGGRGFFYVDENGDRIGDAATLDRIRSLAVPPAYEDVRIAPSGKAHLQAVGMDTAGRLQYRYHPDWDRIRETRKGNRLAILCAALPRIRQRVGRDLAGEGVGRERVLAGVVTLIDRTHIRIGCEDYVHSGRSRGAATLLKRNIKREGDRFLLIFRGKGGKQIETSVKAAGLGKLFPALMKLPGARIFQYRTDDGAIRHVTAAQVNAYLSEIAGAPVSAKDLRTLAATALAAQMLSDVRPATSKTGTRRQIKDVMAAIADRLCNTPAVVRKSYVHDRLIDVFERGELPRLSKRASAGRRMTACEAVVAALFPTRAASP